MLVYTVQFHTDSHSAKVGHPTLIERQCPKWGKNHLNEGALKAAQRGNT